MFEKILIANRGEIAVRVVRACREMGIRSVAVYSDVDRASLHVRMADEAYPLGPAPATESYLNIDKILDVARRSGAQAIHPGYGFLSENFRFAEACEGAGVKFIGPSSSAMQKMGSKTRARQAALQAGVPMVPGSARGLDLEEARRVAAEIGYPVMLKAAAGGGGKGMRRVEHEKELPSAFETARSEAQRAFGDGELYVEKLILRPRHIEVQVFGDEHGNMLWLGERECTVQRRHQKVLEESPSPAVSPSLRQKMGETAARLARSAGYSNAGTLEFLVDEDRNFYFLEMNTRLQVEHPVTELVTGLDLVQMQIRVAAGEPLSISQEQVQWRGHAIECRIYAEDPENAFFPSPGKITLLKQAAGPGIREDSGVYEGWNVPLEYDPLLSKLIAYGSDRQQAIARLSRALDEYFVGGIKSNLGLFRKILRDRAFIAGELDTGFLDRLLASPPAAACDGNAEIAAIAAALFTAMDSLSGGQVSTGTSAETESAWKLAGRREAMRGLH